MKKTLFIIVLIIFMQSSLHSGLKPFSNNYYIVMGNNLNVRSNPNTKANVVIQLKILSEVKLLRLKNKEVKIGNIKGKWAFIDTRVFNDDVTDTIKGWVFNYYLSNTKEFILMTKFKECSLEDNVGDTFLSYRFNKNGTYIRKDYDSEKNKYYYLSGNLYKYRNVIIASDKDKERGIDVSFYLKQDGRLCSKYYNSKGKQICSNK